MYTCDDIVIFDIRLVYNCIICLIEQEYNWQATWFWHISVSQSETWLSTRQLPLLFISSIYSDFIEARHMKSDSATHLFCLLPPLG